MWVYKYSYLILSYPYDGTVESSEIHILLKIKLK